MRRERMRQERMQRGGIGRSGNGIRDHRRKTMRSGSRDFGEERSRGCARHAANAVRRNGPAPEGIGIVAIVREGICGTLIGEKREGQIVEVEGGAAARPTVAARKSVLFLAIHENPFGDARLDVHFDELVHDFNEFLAKIGAVVQTCELEGFEGNSGAGGEVFEHWFAGLHARTSGDQPHIMNWGDWEAKNTLYCCGLLITSYFTYISNRRGITLVHRGRFHMLPTRMEQMFQGTWKTEAWGDVRLERVGGSDSDGGLGTGERRAGSESSMGNE